MALASLVASRCRLLAGHQRIVEFTLTANACEAANAEHVMTCLHWAINAYELALKPNVHDVHVDVDCVLAVWVHRLTSLWSLGRLRAIWSKHHVRRMRRTHQILLLTTLSIDTPLTSSRRATATNAASHLLSLQILLRTPAISAATLWEAMTISHAIILRLRQIILTHHGWTEQTIKVFLIHAAHVRIHHSRISCCIRIFDLVTT